MQLTHLPSSPLQVMSVEQLSVQRKSLQRSVSVGCLSSGELLLTLRKGRGSHGNTTLTLEEALFNMECGGLEPCCNQLPVTIQQVYHSLVGLELYQAYAALRRVGHRVQLNTSMTGPAALKILSVSPPLLFLLTELGAQVQGTHSCASGVTLTVGNSQTFYLLSTIEIEFCV
ncbi:uncharacterized protein LOC135351574 isoform X1 [Halichondria panicea]|uniref:uncharacterized protein LOC135351574 isoform X1 n=1 Tax=Halichondria panicea TaxID=6063 RepID=UPI00312BB46E